MSIKSPGGDMSTKFVEGESYIVTGDSAKAAHQFAAGTEVVLEEICADNLHFCRDSRGDSWYVDAVDLAPAIVPVTDAEMAEVYKSLGVQE